MVVRSADQAAPKVQSGPSQAFEAEHGHLYLHWVMQALQTETCCERTGSPTRIQG